MALRSLRDELEMLKHEVEAMKATAPGDAGPEGGPTPSAGTELESQLGELTQMVKTMLDEAEDTVTRHPMATVAGALALGIVIGRLTAR